MPEKFLKKMTSQLAMIKLKRATNLLYGLRQNLRSESEQFFVSERYMTVLEKVETTKQVYVLEPGFFEKLAVEMKRKHLINVVGLK